MSAYVVNANGVSKILGSGAGRVWALRDVDVSLRGGELTMLMGPSGSGKTTLLSVLGCMLAPSSGSIEICGRSTKDAGPEQLAELRREYIGFVFQQYHLFPTLTALENVQLALEIRSQRGTSSARKTKDALALVGLSHKFSSYPQELSGGEQQRVAIARAIVSAPSVILADEPTAALDGRQGQVIMQILEDIASADAARTILVVTHDSRLTSFAKRILMIEDGRIISERGGHSRKQALQLVRAE